ncbi:MAG: type III-A CRISPR-associated RAMP protein Csm4 [Candidatus Bipolaricaulaceae bacterium]
MRVSLFKLTFPHGLHISPHELSLDDSSFAIPADTLFSALLSAWVRRGMEAVAWLDPFLGGKPPFLLTSAFPYSEKGLSFPKPFHLRLFGEWRHAEFLPETAFYRLCKGDSQGLEEGTPEEFWKIEQIPRVSLDRFTNRSNLFFVGRVHFRPGCGLWFGVAWLQPEERCQDLPFREAFMLALRELAATGLGGDRCVGYGQFEFELLDEVDWPDPAPGGCGVLLSRLWPKEEEIPALRDSLAWRFVEVGGWAETPAGHVRRKRVRLVKEGSVVPAGVQGGLADLTPPGFAAHRIWRYGYAFLYPLEVGHGA